MANGDSFTRGYMDALKIKQARRQPQKEQEEREAQERELAIKTGLFRPKGTEIPFAGQTWESIPQMTPEQREAIARAYNFGPTSMTAEGKIGYGPERREDTVVVEVGGRKVLVNSQTGEMIKDLGIVTSRELELTPYQKYQIAERRLKETLYPEEIKGFVGAGVPYAGRTGISRIGGGKVQIPKEQAFEIRRNIQEALEQGITLEDLERRLRGAYRIGEYDYQAFMGYAKEIESMAKKKQPWLKRMKTYETQMER